MRRFGFNLLKIAFLLLLFPTPSAFSQTGERSESVFPFIRFTSASGTEDVTWWSSVITDKSSQFFRQQSIEFYRELSEVMFHQGIYVIDPQSKSFNALLPREFQKKELIGSDFKAVSTWFPNVYFLKGEVRWVASAGSEYRLLTSFSLVKGDEEMWSIRREFTTEPDKISIEQRKDIISSLHHAFESMNANINDKQVSAWALIIEGIRSPEQREIVKRVLIDQIGERHLIFGSMSMDKNQLKWQLKTVLKDNEFVDKIKNIKVEELLIKDIELKDREITIHL